MTKKVFPGRYESLQHISDFISQAAQKAGLNDSAVYAVQLAVDEAATNIIEHAYGGEGNGNIECTYELLPEGLRVALIDHGKPFDPDEVPEPQTNGSLDDIKPRGLGLFFMRRMMDEVKFEFTRRSGNRVVMLKRK
jgi:serine/threonine-protein kinase RsbW